MLKAILPWYRWGRYWEIRPRRREILMVEGYLEDRVWFLNTSQAFVEHGHSLIINMDIDSTVPTFPCSGNFWIKAEISRVKGICIHIWVIGYFCICLFWSLSLMFQFITWVLYDFPNNTFCCSDYCLLQNFLPQEMFLCVGFMYIVWHIRWHLDM